MARRERESKGIERARERAGSVPRRSLHGDTRLSRVLRVRRGARGEGAWGPGGGAGSSRVNGLTGRKDDDEGGREDDEGGRPTACKNKGEKEG